MHSVTSFWAIEFWKNLSGIISFSSQLSIQIDQLSTDKLIEPDVLNYLFTSRMIALFHVLDALSDKHGIKRETILAFAQAENIFQVTLALEELPEPAQDYYHATLDLMNYMISGDQISDRTLGYFGQTNPPHQAGF